MDNGYSVIVDQENVGAVFSVASTASYQKGGTPVLVSQQSLKTFSIIKLAYFDR